MYNSKDLILDKELTFLSYNQTINAEFRLDDLLESPLWLTKINNGLVEAIPLFNCDEIKTNNSSDIIIDENKMLILQNKPNTLIKCISNDTGNIHYYDAEVYAYTPYSKLDVIDDVSVYCIVYDKYLNVLMDVEVEVYINNDLIDVINTDSEGLCHYNVSEASTIKFVYGESISNEIIIDGSEVYTLSIETDKQTLFTDESVTVTGVLTVDGEVYADQSIDLYDGSTLIDTVVTDNNGEYSKTVNNLSVGTHVFRAINVHVRSSNVSVSVNAHSYSLSIISDKQSILTSESVTISGTLLMDSNPYTGQSIQLYDGSTLIDTLTTDNNGEYTKTLTGLTAGTHTFKAVNTNAESSTVSVTVSEPTPVHNYSLSVTGTAIIQTGDNDNITATLKDNGVVVSGETLSYQIKHGSTIIDSGTDTTDSNGQITITYTGTGVGDVSVIVSYGSLLQETYDVEDCWNTSLTEQSITNSGGTKISSIGLDTVHNVQSDDFILEFDGKGNGVLNIGSKNNWSQSTANYRVTIGIDSNRSDFYYSIRTTSTSDGYYGSSSINTYYHYRIVKEGHDIKFYVDEQLMTTKSESFFTNYDTWSIYSIIWGSGTQTIKNIRIKAL